jgi:myo-inositol 2-dehydrogenase/D-chiro-inositol 1-dehydrogenase
MPDITRRGAVAALTSNILLVPPETAFGSQANSAVAMGIIGTGGRGRYVGTLFAKDPRARIAAICDIFPDRIDLGKTQIPTADQARVYRDYKELLRQADIDAVLIATPVYLHPEHFEAAVKARKHIYCEKPAGADVPGVLRLMRAVEGADKSKTIFFGFQQRYSPEYLAAEKILRSGQLGELLLMKSDWILGGARLTSDRPNVPPASEEQKIRQWGAWRETSGDFIIEQDCHGLDVLNWFAQAHPLKARGAGGRRKRAFGDNRDHYNITYEYPGGLIGWLVATQLAVKQYWDVKEQFFGTEGILETERKYYKWHRDAKDVLRVDSKREITIDAVEAFLTRILGSQPYNQGLSAAESTLTSLLGRMAVDTGREVTWEELLRSA